MTEASAEAQHLLELANRFRLDPAGAFARMIERPGAERAFDADTTAALRFFGVDLGLLRRELGAVDPAPPLAWSDRLAAAADAHAHDLIAADAQTHRLPGGPTVLQRIEAEGYRPGAWAENVFSYAEGARHAHEAFVIDWGEGPDGMQTPRGHRDALVFAPMREAGIAVLAEGDADTRVGPFVVVQKLASALDAAPILSGVAYADRDGDGGYSSGEGQAGMRIRSAGDGATRSAQAGGWRLEPGEGRADVTLFGAPVSGRIRFEIAVGADNAKLDLRDGRHLATSADLDLARGAASVTVLGAGDVDLTGRPGRDRLSGGEGANRLAGEGGNDRLFGAGGADALSGGSGRDRLTGGDGADALAGNGGRDRLAAGRGRDSLEGGAKDDALGGGRGRDRLDGGRGDDTLAGGRGDDSLGGGAGRDRIDGGGGDDRAEGGAGGDRIEGAGGDDRLAGNGGRDRLAGGAGNDRIAGDRGDDRLEGGAGRDRLTGGGGDDRLEGGRGRDRLEGGAGDDRLAGGGGADVFRFGPADGRDRIEDWHEGERLDLRPAGAAPDDVTLDIRGADAVVAVFDTVIVVEDAAGRLALDAFLFG